VASYSGDANNKRASSGCADEPVRIAAPAVVTAPRAQVISGLARVDAPQECVTGVTPLYVTGRQIKSVTFYLDGRKVKSIARPDRKGRYGIKVNSRKLRFVVHRARMVVVFTTSSETKPQTLRLVLIRCPVPHPRFTG
jgi:hypothetical protein